MKVKDLVKDKNHPEYGTGKIISFLQTHGTVMVKFENLEAPTYHISNNLIKP